MTNVENGISRAYIVGDLHLGVRNNSSVWSEIQEDFLLNIFPKQLTENNHDPETSILILEGDIFHSRQSLDIKIFQGALLIFEKLSKMFRKIYIILGNHDVYYKDTNEVNSVSVISRLYPKIKVLEKHEILKINDKHSYLLLPWVQSLEKITQTIELYSGKCEYIICHADIKGASLNKFAKIEKGIDPNVLKDYKKVYAGHIHIRQEVKKYGANVLYTGTPYSMDKGDTGNQKGFDILNFVDDLVTETFVPNNESPRFIRKNLYQLLEMSVAQINDMFKNSFVDVAISNDIVNRFSVTTFVEMIKDANYRKIEFSPYSNSKKMDTKGIVENEETAEFDMNIESMMGKYIDQKRYEFVLKSKIKNKFTDLHTRVKEASKKE